MRIFKRHKKAAKALFSARSFMAAQVDRLLANWRFDGGFTPSEITNSLSIIRSRSRDMAKNSPHFKRWLQLVETNVVGEGFTLKSQPHDVRNGSAVLDQAAAKFIEYHWWRFCNYRDPRTTRTWFDYSGVKTEPEMDRLAVKTWKRDGEYFIQIIRGAQNPYGISFRMLRPDWCDEKYNVVDTGRGTIVQAGVEMETVSRTPVAYWFTAPPKAVHGYHTPTTTRVPIPANEIIHGYTQEDEGQPRGIPHSYPVLRKLKMLDEYDTAELTAARDEACTVRTYEAKDEGSNPEEFIDLNDEDNAVVAAALTSEKQPGQSEIVPRGYSMKVQTPQHPNRELTAFKSSMLKDVASGFGVEYANFANDWKAVSFSSVRGGTISERDSWKVIQRDMISQCKSVQFLVWLESFLSLSVSGAFPISKIEKFAEHEFRGRRWMWVDPARDMNATKMAVENGWKTNTDAAADIGEDYFDNLEQMKREKDALEKLGLAEKEATE